MIPQKNQQFTEEELQSEFDIQYMGGIRKSIKNKVIVLVHVSDPQNPTGYEDMVDEDAGLVRYVGHGQGDQTMTMNNKVLLDSKNDGYTVLYFDKPEPNKLIFRFPVEYESHSFEDQKNTAGLLRKVILFKLRILDKSN